MTALSPEAFWLTATTAMTSAFWFPYIVNRLAEQGILTALWDPHGDTTTRRAWADRMMRAHKNGVENLCVFAPLALLVTVSGTGSQATATAAATYFFARLAHYVVFALGLPVIRVLMFLVGFACQATLALHLLKLGSVS